MKTLVAGIGNIFHGDDGFGVDVARQLVSMPMPPGVKVGEFGIRSYDLAYAIADGYDQIIFIDAVSRGSIPGTLYLLELDPENVTAADRAVNGHNLNLMAVLQMVRAFGGKIGRLFLVGCEPAVLERGDGELKLSPNVAATVPEAVHMICSLLSDLEEQREISTTEQTGLAETAMDR